MKLERFEAMLSHAFTFYSQYLCCIYDEAVPVGQIGRGSHYSVLRSLVWHSEKDERLAQAVVHNLAVIWDEDHDNRIIPCIEALLVEGLLHHIVYIGERKGGVTIVLSSLSAVFLQGQRRQKFEASVTAVINSVVQKFEDSWTCTFGDMTETASTDSGSFQRSLINDDFAKVDIYLRNIDNLWRLGRNMPEFADV